MSQRFYACGHAGRNGLPVMQWISVCPACQQARHQRAADLEQQPGRDQADEPVDLNAVGWKRPAALASAGGLSDEHIRKTDRYKGTDRHDF